MATELVLKEALVALRHLEHELDQLEALALDDWFDGRLGEVREVVDDIYAILELAVPDLEIGPDDDDEDDDD